MKTDLNQEPVFLTDKNRIVVLEALCSAPNAALPDTCRPYEVLEPVMAEGASEKHLQVVETEGLRPGPLTPTATFMDYGKRKSRLKADLNGKPGLRRIRTGSLG